MFGPTALKHYNLQKTVLLAPLGPVFLFSFIPAQLKYQYHKITIDILVSVHFGVSPLKEQMFCQNSFWTNVHQL